MQIARRVVVLAALVMLSGCNSGYYLHLYKGHMALMDARRPLSAVIADEATDPQLKQRLQLVLAVRDYAATELGLPVDEAYGSYVPLERDHVVYNLFAAPEFSLVAHQWCYPVVGCASYRGYFDLERARRDAAQLREQSLDVYGAGARAYSTLGWFDDPVTDLMLQGSDVDVARLLFHELSHRRFYLKGDTRFNESLATAVARESARRWQASLPGPVAAPHAASAESARRLVLGWVDQARAELADLYASGQGEGVLREQKARIIDALRQRYRQALADNPALAPWQHWFEGPLNNAQLNTLQDYQGWVGAFDQLLLDCGGQWACFWPAVERLATLDDEERHMTLDALADD